MVSFPTSCTSTFKIPFSQITSAVTLKLLLIASVIFSRSGLRLNPDLISKNWPPVSFAIFLRDSSSGPITLARAPRCISPKIVPSRVSPSALQQLPSGCGPASVNNIISFSASSRQRMSLPACRRAASIASGPPDPPPPASRSSSQELNVLSSDVSVPLPLIR